APVDADRGGTDGGWSETRPNCRPGELARHPANDQHPWRDRLIRDRPAVEERHARAVWRALWPLALLHGEDLPIKCASGITASPLAVPRYAGASANARAQPRSRRAH